MQTVNSWRQTDRECYDCDAPGYNNSSMYGTREFTYDDETLLYRVGLSCELFWRMDDGPCKEINYVAKL